MKNIQIKCKKCGNIFIPDLNTRGDYWNCKKCNEKIPNLRRHYRSIADVFIIGLISTLVFAGLVYKDQQSEHLVGFITSVILQIILLLIVIIGIYSAKAPWQSSKINALIWIIFGGSFFFNLLAPLFIIVMGAIDIPFLKFFSSLPIFNFSILFVMGGGIASIPFSIFIFSYLFWLRLVIKKCSLTEEIADIRIKN